MPTTARARSSTSRWWRICVATAFATATLAAQAQDWSSATEDECPLEGTVEIRSQTQVTNNQLTYDVIDARTTSADGSFVCSSVVVNSQLRGIYKSPTGEGAPFENPAYAVPEPATYAQVGLGLALMVWLGVRRKRRR